MLKYFPQQFESKWIEVWEKEKIYKAPNNKSQITNNKQYVLSMFPYPSAAGLHVGHARIYTGTDVLARFLRMKGHTVLHPMGWDAFGLPAENAAIAAKKNPMDMVPQNIASFKRQMKMLGFSYDWEREFSTTDPEYYKWTQWLFIQFFKTGLLYKKHTPINFCPACKTGLAEEEVLSDGTHERCGNKITKKELPQWIFRITAYADRLLEDLKGLDWPPGILEMQRNWIGRKEGINITYNVDGFEEKVTVFTTAPVNFGATFLVVAPEHEIVKKIIEGKINVPESSRAEVKQYIEISKRKTERERIDEKREKTGVFTGLWAINHVTNGKIPIWVTDFVLVSVGTGAVQGCPGHDIRDFQFARKFNIPIVRVIAGEDGDESPIERENQVIEHGQKGHFVNSDFLNGLEFDEGLQKTMDYFEKKGWGKRVVTYHLHDWIFSRQRYWGEPIPMIFCQSCAEKKISYFNVIASPDSIGAKQSQTKKIASSPSAPRDDSLAGWFPVPEDQLPIKLPFVKSYQPTETGESPLAKIDSFVKTKCPHCGGEARRETDTMPNWAGSCWYFLAFAFANPKGLSLNKDRPYIKTWLPVDWYLGGAEHAVLHLLYARFWVKALQDLRLLHFSEPFLRLRNVGMVLAEDHRKMSKSFGNVINPDDVVDEYGADTLRIYEMFMAPFSSEIAWSTKALQGGYRFLTRIWQIYHNPTKLTNKVEEEDKKLVAKLQKTILKVSSDITNVKFNTAIAAMMEFLNEWETAIQRHSGKRPSGSEGAHPESDSGQARMTIGLSTENSKKFLQILAPFAPFITEEIWREVFGEKTSIHLSEWPKVGEKMVDEEMVIPVQVNGKLRGTIKVQSSKFKVQSYIEKEALKQEKVKKYLEGKKYKMIYVEGKVINFVIK